MPNMKQSDLDLLNESIDSLAAENSNLRTEAAQNQRRIRCFDTILDKIIETADGMLIGGLARGYDGVSFTPWVNDQGIPRARTIEEHQREKIASLYERIVGLERTVASVRAIAAFAKVHKA